MHVTMLWFGGVNYSAPGQEDAETFDSLKDARETFWQRADFDPQFPCVESPAAWLFIGKLPKDGDLYPDYILTLGPRGGVRQERT